MRRLYHIFSTLKVGGPQKRFATIVDGSIGVDGLSGYEHYVSAVDENYAALSLIKNRDRVHIHPLNLVKNTSLSADNLSIIGGAIKALNPDQLLTYNWGSIEAALCLRLGLWGTGGLSHLHFEDGFGADETVERQKRQRAWMRRFALSRASSKIVVPSQSLQRLATQQWGFSSNKIIHIDNGIDLVHFTPGSVKSDGRLTIGTVAALRAEKNLFRLIDVVAMLPRETTRLMIVGEGPERASLQAHGARMGLMIDFLGHKPDPASYYQQMDIFALTSDTEQMPLGVLEAMACGLPIVATDVGDVAAMVCEDNKAFIKKRGDDPALAEAIEILRADPQARQNIGRLNRAKAAQHYSLQKMLAAYEALFQGQGFEGRVR